MFGWRGRGRDRGGPPRRARLSAHRHCRSVSQSLTSLHTRQFNSTMQKITVFLDIESFAERIREKKIAKSQGMQLGRGSGGGSAGNQGPECSLQQHSNPDEQLEFVHKFDVEEYKLSVRVDPYDKNGGVLIEISHLPVHRAEVYCKITLGLSNRMNSKKFLLARDATGDGRITLRLGAAACWMVKTFNRFLEKNGELKLKVELEFKW